jgi:hypothetical protein
MPRNPVESLDFLEVDLVSSRMGGISSTDHAYRGGHQHARRINFWPASSRIKSRRPRSLFQLTFDESEKVGVHPLRIDYGDAVGATLVDLQNGVRNDRWYATASRTDRHDLIVFAVYDE